VTVLVTGAAGFIGSAVCQRLLDEGQSVLGLDNLNSYYAVSLKKSRLGLLRQPNFEFCHLDVGNTSAVSQEAQNHGVTQIVHLAAQAGVRHSIQHPEEYVSANLVGFAGMLELARNLHVEHFVYASSSSVYGANTKIPYSVADEVNHPVSFYAATKRANEVMAESYSHLFDIPSTGLRFFTAYGPFGRPDMAIPGFTKKIIEGEPVRLFGDGLLTRDFTYIDDVVTGVLLCLAKPPTRQHGAPGPRLNETTSPHRVLNVGNGKPVSVLEVLDELEREIGKPAIRQLVETQPGDVDHTLADISQTTEWCGYLPTTEIATGIPNFVRWYRDYYGA
jgi:UDP-glucuronate 4-epimerase